MTLISGKLMYMGVISVIIIAVASYGFFFLSESTKRVSEKAYRIGTGEADKFYQVNFTTCWLRSWHQRGLETFVFIDISSNEYMKQTKESLKPV